MLRRAEPRKVLAEMRDKVRGYGLTPQQLYCPDKATLVRFRVGRLAFDAGGAPTAETARRPGSGAFSLSG